MPLAEKQQALIEDLNLIHDPHERLSVVMARGHSARLAAESKTNEHLVPGCISRVWVTASCRDGHWRFQCDADSPMVKGLVALLCELYSGSTAVEILSTEPDVWERCGFDRLLSPTRRNGLLSVRRRICQLVSSPEALPLPAPAGTAPSGGNSRVTTRTGQAATNKSAMPLRFYDAHNHLHDERLAPFLGPILRDLPPTGIACAVVNGSCEADWAPVAELAAKHPWIKPSFGLHPWYVPHRSPRWRDALVARLAEFPNAAIGEIGLDRWIENPQIESQIEAFQWQLELAAELGRPASIHCLRAWGLLEQTLKASPRPERGFLLHSYGGPAEMIPSLAKLGAYFSLSPYFLHERKSAQREVFKLVPLDRLLAESDAPDMWPPDAMNAHRLHDATGQPLNHPANIKVSYRALAELRSMSLEALAAQIEQNFGRLFL